MFLGLWGRALDGLGAEDEVHEDDAALALGLAMRGDGLKWGLMKEGAIWSLKRASLF